MVDVHLPEWQVLCCDVGNKCDEIVGVILNVPLIDDMVNDITGLLICEERELLWIQ